MKEVLASRELMLKNPESRFEIERRINGLEKAGFQNCENIRLLKRQLVGFDVFKYRDKYPTYLYFTDDAFDDIVRRNNLKISPVRDYKGSIPEHCVDAILNENVQKEDMRFSVIAAKIESTITHLFLRVERSFFEEESKWKEKILKWSKYDIERKAIEQTESDNYRRRYMCPTLPEVGSPEKYVFMALYGVEHPSLSLKDRCTFNISFVFDEKYSQLYIAAPGNRIQSADPIVFRYVRDGILVITFWE